MEGTEKILHELAARVSVLETKLAVLQDRVSGMDGQTVFDREDNEKKRERDKTRFSLDGKVYLKSHFVLAVVKKYVDEHPDVTYDGLLSVFDDKKQGSFGVVRRAGDVDPESVRFFVRQPLTLSDGNVYVCSQWGKDNVENIFRLAVFLGYDVTKIQQSPDQGETKPSAVRRGSQKSRVDPALNPNIDVAHAHLYLEWEEGYRSLAVLEKHPSHFIINDRDCYIEYTENRTVCDLVHKTVEEDDYAELIAVFYRHGYLLSEDTTPTFMRFPHGGAASYKYSFNGKENFVGVPELFSCSSDAVADLVYADYNAAVDRILNR